MSSSDVKDLEQEIKEMREQLNRIEKLLIESVGKNCEKMGNHIDFVESVYDTVRHPLSYICNKINGTPQTMTLPHSSVSDSYELESSEPYSEK
jgi:hypothetical protein